MLLKKDLHRIGGYPSLSREVLAMSLPIELRDEIGRLRSRVQALKDFLKVDDVRQNIAKAEEKMAVPGFWDSPMSAQEFIAKVQQWRSSVAGFLALNERFGDVLVLAELLESEPGSSADSEGHLREMQEDLARLSDEMDALEIASFLHHPRDRCNALMMIHAGAGGTESCDWADMLLRMYIRWTERNSLKCEIQDMQPGEGAGISNVTLRIEGEGT
jgi:peptide chain release factor 2